jgi:hypothetical protein
VVVTEVLVVQVQPLGHLVVRAVAVVVKALNQAVLELQTKAMRVLQVLVAQIGHLVLVVVLAQSVGHQHY